MRLVLAVVPLLLAVSVGPCRHHEIEAPLDQPFELAVGGAVLLTATDLHVGFVRVDADSRCPRGVQCITAGEARVTFTASAGQQAPEELRLRLRGGGPDTADVTTFHGFRLQLTELDPAPAAGVRTDSTAYVATIVVRRGE